MEIYLVPLILGGGARLFEGGQRSDPRLEQIRAVQGSGVTLLKYRVTK